MSPAFESRCESTMLRGLRYNVRHWGSPESPKLFLLHGWMDSSATFQFVVEALRQNWHVIAPDWRGYGASQYLGQPYWFPDYYADLDALLDHYLPDEPARLVGHSMGASIAATYAGVRPQRVAQLVMLDFLGLKNNVSDEAPDRLGLWLEQGCGQPRLASYADYDALAERFLQSNHRLTKERASFIARHVSHQLPDGRVQMACDPWHKVASPHLYRVEDAMACWRMVRAPVLLLIADRGFVHERLGDAPEEYQRRLSAFCNVCVRTIEGAGHNVQHDQPEQVARAVENFLKL